jgi:hypothetical protein
MTSQAAQPAEEHCPECGALVAPTDADCWLCYRPLVVVAEMVESPALPPVIVRAPPRPIGRAQPLQFSIETLLLVTTLVAVCLGLSLSAPGLGIPLAIIAGPALVRTLIAGHRERAAGHKLSMGEKVLTFLASTGIMVAVVAAGCAAFFATCTGVIFGGMALHEATGRRLFGTGPGDVWVLALILLSSAVGLGTAGWIFWLTRPRRK